MTEVAAVKEEYEVTVADVTAEMELELSKAKSLLEAGTQAESKAKESISGLNDALHQVTMEADEVKAVALTGRKKQWQQNVNWRKSMHTQLCYKVN